MSFGNQLKKFAEMTTEQMRAASAEDEARAKQTLRDILGEDVLLIKDVTYDQSLGKFYAIDAPQSVIDRLRDAGVLKD